MALYILKDKVSGCLTNTNEPPTTSWCHVAILY